MNYIDKIIFTGLLLTLTTFIVAQCNINKLKELDRINIKLDINITNSKQEDNISLFINNITDNIKTKIITSNKFILCLDYNKEYEVYTIDSKYNTYGIYINTTCPLDDYTLLININIR